MENYFTFTNKVLNKLFYLKHQIVKGLTKIYYTYERGLMRTWKTDLKKLN